MVQELRLNRTGFKLGLSWRVKVLASSYVVLKEEEKNQQDRQCESRELLQLTRRWSNE